VLPFRTLDFLSFDPQELPERYVRVVGAATTVGALTFTGIAIYGYVMANRTLSERVTDFLAMLLIMKFFFFFAVCGVSAAMAFVLAIISYRCWHCV
jgi:hypothetical protein